MWFKDISYLELWWPFCSAEQNHLCNFGRGHHEEDFCETRKSAPRGTDTPGRFSYSAPQKSKDVLDLEL